MRDKLIITTFTDPMMGLSWECEPLFRKLETHFAGQIEFRTVMALLVRDVRDFMLPDELALPLEEGVRRYNARLAKIYESEEPISGMPINMTAFCLFDAEHTSSMPLNLAYHAAKLTDVESAERFLYNLRYATVVDCRPATRTEELLSVAQKTGLDADTFLRHFSDGSAQAMLDEDLRFARSIGIRSLPAYLLQYGEKAVLLQSFEYKDFVKVIAKLSEGTMTPRLGDPSAEALCELLSAHPLISLIEIQAAFDLVDTEAVRVMLQPLMEAREVEIIEIRRGWFIRRR